MALVTVDISSYENFRAAILGNGYDVDGIFGYQCLTADHVVLMHDGSYRKIENIKPGDYLYGHKYVITNHVRKSPIYKISTTLGNFKTTPNHKFILKDGEEREASDVKIGDELMIDKSESEEMFELTDDELRFLGFYLGDGTKSYRYLTSNIPMIRITVGTEEKSKYLESLNVVTRKIQHSNGKAFIYSLVNAHHVLLTNLIHTMDKKKLPHNFSARQYRLIIEGYTKADGSLHRNQTVCVSVDKELLVSIQHGCIINGWTARLTDAYYREKTNFCLHPKPIYRLYISKNTLCNSGKVLEVEKLKEKESVYILNITGDHLYSADNVIHHNCVDLAKLLAGNAGRDYPYWKSDPDGYAYEGWTVLSNREYNAADYFTLIYNKADVRTGDMVILRNTSSNPYGHIGFANSDWTADTTTAELLGQNQVNPNPDTGHVTTLTNVDVTSFLGAFRFNRWQPLPPPPVEEKRQSRLPLILTTLKRLNKI